MWSERMFNSANYLMHGFTRNDPMNFYQSTHARFPRLDHYPRHEQATRILQAARSNEPFYIRLTAMQF